MPEDSLKETVNGFGDIEVKDSIHDRYADQLNNQVLWGEPLDTKDLGTAIRKYDHGQASEQTVTETGVKAAFDPEKTDLEALQDDGSIREGLRAIATEHFPDGPLTIDLIVTDDAYIVWLIPEQASLF